MARSERKLNRVLSVIDSISKRMIEISDTMYAKPELGGEEYKAVELLTSELERHGFRVEKQIAGIKTAFKASYVGKSERPAIALLAEYDALPGIGHGCGHNLSGTASVCAAIGLSKVLHDLNGSVVVVGTPGEENLSCKVPMVKRGVFRDIDAAMMTHMYTLTTVNVETLALDALEFEFRGKAAHAAVAPHKGIDALDAAILLFNAINALREHVIEGTRIHGIITEGGRAPNIVPEKAVAHFYTRARSRRYLNEVTEKVKNCARAAALATGAKIEIRNFEPSLDNIIMDKKTAQIFANNLRKLGVEVEEAPVFLGSTDVGNVSHVVPTIHPLLAIAPKEVVLHTKEFARATVSDKGHKGMVLAAKAMSMTAMKLLTTPEYLDRVRSEFATRLKTNDRS